jgi:hypothetical protein
MIEFLIFEQTFYYSYFPLSSDQAVILMYDVFAKVKIFYFCFYISQLMFLLSKLKSQSLKLIRNIL